MLNLNDYTIVCVDFETYYDDLFTLKNLTALEYITDARFKVHMMGACVDFDDNTLHIVPSNKIPTFVNRLRNAAKPVALLCQNTRFDGLILSHHYGYTANLYLDTRAMSKGLWPHASSSLKHLAERLWPDQPHMRKGTELAQSKGVRDLPPELFQTLAGYCQQDVALTQAAFEVMLPLFPPAELPIIDMLTRWCVEPVLELDYELMARYVPKLETDRKRLIAASNLWRFGAQYNKDTKGRPQFEKEFAKELARERVNAEDREFWISLKVLNSNKAFVEWLKLNGIQPTTKLTPAGKLSPALAQNDPQFIALMQQHPTLAPVWEARAAAKSTQALSRALRFIQTANAFNGRVPVPLGYNNAHTGRLGGEEGLNMQNLQRNADPEHRDGDLRPGALRRALCAPEGHVIVVGDLSNIEARMLAYLAEHATLLDVFATAGDPYAWMAEKIFNTPITKKTHPFERNVGKVALLSLGYGAGVNRFTMMLHSGPMGMDPIHFTDPNMYALIVATYRRDNAPIGSLWQWGSIMIELMANPEADFNWRDILHFTHRRIRLPSGLSLEYPNLRPTREGWEYDGKDGPKRLFGAALVENITQALSNCVIKEAMLRAEHALNIFDGRLVLQVHDELVGIAPTGHADAALQALLTAMSVTPSWAPGLPVAVEGAYAPNYCK